MRVCVVLLLVLLLVVLPGCVLLLLLVEVSMLVEVERKIIWHVYF